MQSILDTLQDRGDCNQFLRAIFLANFINILEGKGPYTVFVPTDQAFSNINALTLHALFADNSKLADMVSEHLIIGNYEALDLERSDEVVNLNHRSLAVERHNEGLIVGGAKIIEPNIECTDGYIHMVDLVLLP